MIRHLPFIAFRTSSAIIGIAVVSVALLSSRHTWAQEKLSDNEALLAAEQAAFRAAAEKASPSVVQIETFGGLERVGQELISDGPTTGTVVADGGWIISTLYSFRQQPASILVTLTDGKRVPAKIVARDHSRELALLKLEESTSLPPAVPAPIKSINVGQWTVALGKTFDKSAVSQSVGIISALGRANNKAVQTDAKVSPVNYGGPLIDLEGRVIGILAPISPGAILEGDSSQLYDSGIGFAVPLEDILARLPAMQEGKDIRSGKLGVVVSDQNELAGPVKVAGAAPGSPAAKAGLKAGDMIVEAAGQPVTLLAHLRHALGPADAGSEFRFSVDRKGKRIELNAVLAAEVPTYRSRYLGLECEADGDAGLKITAVRADSPAETAKLQIGRHIVDCNGTPMRTPKDLREQVAVAELDEPLHLVIKHDGQESKIDITPTIWSDEIEPAAAASAQSKSLTIEESELALGDFPNKVTAWTPIAPAKAEGDSTTDKPMGLLVIVPEPGEPNRKAIKETFDGILRDGWIVACIQSSDQKRWSSEEIELVGRVIHQIDEKHSIDSARTAVAGIGAGSRLALIAARAAKDDVTGVVMIAAPLEGIRVQKENSPLETPHFLFIGAEKSYREFLKQLQKFGYPATGLPTVLATPLKWETLPVGELRDWLHGLGRI
ncbi:MAG: PDZ domain-containing protein [Pirellulales bacterium]